MKLLVIGSIERFEKFFPPEAAGLGVECVVVPRGSADEAVAAVAPDADFLMVDAIGKVSPALITALPQLKLIHSEGVAYNGIDLEAARERGIPVCNCKGANAGAVAEQAIMLMLGCLRSVIPADAAVRRAEQIGFKEAKMASGITELAECRIGFIGAGDSAQATMRRLAAWGPELVYHKPRQLAPELEAELGVRYLSRAELLASSDIVSLHLPANAETHHLVDADFFAQMKPGAILINTARGEIVDQEALAAALESGHLAAAGLDVLDPEPVQADNPLLNLSPAAAARVVFSPHMAGITTGTFRRVHAQIWQNIARVMAGEEPIDRVA